MTKEQHEQIGPTGEYPHGKLGSDDKGELGLGIAADVENNVVVMKFGVPTSWLAFPPEAALALAGLLGKAAAKLREATDANL